MEYSAQTAGFFMLQCTIDVLRTGIHTYTAALGSDGRQITDVLGRFVVIVYGTGFTRRQHRIQTDSGISGIGRGEPVVL